MTYGNLKYLVKSLLIGDNTLTKDNSEVLVLLDYALDKVATESDALKLFTANNIDERIVRQGPGKMWIRRPRLPDTDDDELDLDHELSFPLARFMCSFVSREKFKIHEEEAMKLIRAYNQKVQVFFENMEQDGELDEYSETDQFAKRIYP